MLWQPFYFNKSLLLFMLRFFFTTLIIFNSAFSSKLCAQNSDKKILLEVINYTKDWQYNISKKFENKYLLNELENEKHLQISKAFKDSTDIFEIFDNDTVVLENYKFIFSTSIKNLQKSNKKRIGLKVNKLDYSNDSIIFLSHPIYSIDNKIALVWVETYCGGLCGGGELFILDNQNGNWRIIDRIFKTVL